VKRAAIVVLTVLSPSVPTPGLNSSSTAMPSLTCAQSGQVVRCGPVRRGRRFFCQRGAGRLAGLRDSCAASAGEESVARIASPIGVQGCWPRLAACWLIWAGRWLRW